MQGLKSTSAGKKQEHKRAYSINTFNFVAIAIYKTYTMKFNLLFALGSWEVILIVLVILLLFGAKRIPELMKSMGKGVKSFKEGMKEVEKEINTPDESSKDTAQDKESGSK